MIAEIRALAEAALSDDRAATAPPWSVEYTGENGYAVVGPSDGCRVDVGYEEDAAFIAAARSRERRIAEYVLAFESVLDGLRVDAEFSDRMTEDGDRSRAYRQQIRFVDDIRAAIERRLVKP